MSTLINNTKAVFPGEKTASASLRIAAGKVTAIGNSLVPRAEDEIIDAQGRRLTPGLIDLHVHGIMQYSFDNGPDDLLAAAGCLTRFGTTTILPTVVPLRGQKQAHPRLVRETLDKLAALTAALDQVEAVNLPGLHLEGPFLALPGAGAAGLSGDLSLLEDMLTACNHKMRAMSLSPDTANIIPVIERLSSEGVVSFITHTRADPAQTRAAIAAGARHATHFYDVFPPPPDQDPGVRPVGAVEVFLATPETTVDFIADGCHVDPIAIQLAVKAKTCAGVAVITDANIGAGLPPGTYNTPWGYPVATHPDRGARNADPGSPKYGGLSGSALTMNRAMANVLTWIEAPEAQVWAMGTLNPARIAGLDNTGKLQVGLDADLVLWNDDLTPAKVWIRGVKHEFE